MLRLRTTAAVLLLSAIVLLPAPLARAQAPAADRNPPATVSDVPIEGGAVHEGVQVLRRLPKDQAQIFTAPFKLPRRRHAWRYVAPFLAAAAMIPLDRHISSQLPAGHGGVSQTISDVGNFGTAGTLGVLYIFGAIRGDAHARETGLLGAESFVNTLLPRAAVSLALGRDRPFQGSGAELGEGEFFAHHAWSSSFPSGHAAETWAMAGIIADEYPSRPNKFLWYGVGATVAISRVTARQHFVSDVIAGSALGYLIARHIFHAHCSKCKVMAGSDSGN